MWINNPNKEVPVDFFLKSMENIGKDEYRPGISELEENAIICTLWDKEIRLRDFLYGSSELRKEVIQELEKKVKEKEQTKKEILDTLQTEENTNS